MSRLAEPALAPWLPQMSPEVEACLRIVYGLLLAGTVARALPHWKRFFLSDRWGGYGRSAPGVDIIHNPAACPVVLTTWMGAALLLTAGVWTPWAALVTVAISRYYFIQMRWQGVLRGMGAPGFMIYWLGVAVFLLEWSRLNAPAVHALALLAVQIDLACIMAVAGIYKFSAGYARNEGMEFGLANPSWGYWWKQYSAVATGNPVFRIFNHLAWTTELAIGILAVIPRTRSLAGALLFASFAFVGAQIRLGLLAPTMMATALVYGVDGSWTGRQLAALMPDTLVAASAGPAMLSGAGAAAAVAIVAYLALLPLAYGGLLHIFFRRRPLAGLWQRALEAYANACGMTLWRVFSSDVTNFYIVIYEGARDDRWPRRLISQYPGLMPEVPRHASDGLRGRFTQVAESIALTSVFTTLKYYPGNRGLFEDRLIRYARTLPLRPGAQLVFEYVAIRKAADGFLHVPVSEFHVDPVSGRVIERALEHAPPIRKAAVHSPVFAGSQPGSYVPLAS